MRPVRVTLIVISTLFLLSQSIAVARAPAAKLIADDDDQGTSPAPRAVDPKTTAAVTETKEAPAPPAPPLPGEDQFLEARRYHEAGDLVSALPLYEKAAQVGFYEALYYIGQIHEASVAGIESNVTRAVEYYNQSAKLGYPEAMSALGFMYATGRGVDQSIPKSLVYHTFAASGDDMEALRVLGNRYLFGLGVVKNCETSLVAYEKAARMLIEETEFTGVTLVARINLIDEETAPETAEKAASEDDVIEYYRYHAETGDPSAQTWLGSMHMEGWRVLPLEASDELAYEYFKQASAASPDALAHLGYLHLKGRHVEQDNKTAVEYFKLAAARGSTVGMTHLGFLYLRGIAVTQDVAQAFRYFKSAADAGAVEGHNQLGIMHLHGWGVKADPVKAYQYFQNAKKAGHVGATYQFARMHDIGIAPARRSCATAAALYKRVAESVPYTDILKDAYDLYSDGEYEAALVAYERAALMGFEVGQSNAAYIYDRILAKDPERNATEMRLKALTFYELAAEQRRASAYLRIGDFHYYGIAGLKKDLAKAVHYYQVANELGSAHAAWNLGYMYQWGEGLARDLHLAKRFYDASAERSPDATIPAFLARLGLYIHIAYEWLTTERIAPETIGSALAGPAATSATSGGASTPPTLSPTAAQLLRPPRARIAGLEWDTFLLSFCTGLLGLLLWMRLRRQ